MKNIAAIDIWVLVFPGFLLLDATGPVQVFSTANDEARSAGRPPPYKIELVAAGGGAIASSSGVSVLAKPLPRRSMAGATLLVAGGSAMECSETVLDPASMAWLGRAATKVARCCSVCTGAFALARAGLLDERRAVTHWLDVENMRQQFPRVRLQDDAIYVKDGPIYTSAGIAAGMDLALSLVEEDLGRSMALAVAKRLVVFLKRPGGQRQFSSELLAQEAPEGLLGQLTAWLRTRLKLQVDVEQMAAALAVSVRTLHRKLREEADVTPAQVLTRLRMEAACGLLERPGTSVKRAATLSGFGTEYNLRRAFAAHLGVVPSEYKARFG